MAATKVANVTYFFIFMCAKIRYFSQIANKILFFFRSNTILNAKIGNNQTLLPIFEEGITYRLASLEAHIKPFHTMCERSHRYKINPLLSIGTNSIKSDATR